MSDPNSSTDMLRGPHGLPPWSEEEIPGSPLDIANYVAQRRFGVQHARCLPVLLREQLLADLEALLTRIDRVGGPYAS